MGRDLATQTRKRISPQIAAFAAAVAILVLWIATLFLRPHPVNGILWEAGRAKVDLKALGSFDLDPKSGTDESIPVYYRALDGKRVEIAGFMWAARATAQFVQDFQLVYDLHTDGFHPPRVQERVFAHVPNGTVQYVSDLVRVTGILHVKVRRSDDRTIVAVYTLDVEQLQPVR